MATLRSSTPRHNEPFTWRFWTMDWKDGKAGEHTIVSRAIYDRMEPFNLRPMTRPSHWKKTCIGEANEQWGRKVKL